MLFFALALAVGAEAQNKLNTQIARYLHSRQDAMQQSQRAAGQQEEMVPCLIRITAPCTEQLEALGVKTQLELGEIMTAEIPLSAFDKVVELQQVASIEMAQRTHLNSDKARQSTHADKVLHDGVGSGLPKNYNGEGIIIGIVDIGIDFRHPALRNADGSSRCSMVYMPTRKYVEGKGGQPATVNGKTLPGVVYTDKNQIDTLTCDLTNQSHGTHVVAAAAGREIDEYGGVAPGAELFVVASGTDTGDMTTLNAMGLMEEYARAKGKRLVISVSLGYSLGPRDGSLPMTKGLKELANKDVILCLSAGNSGGDNCYIHFTKDSLQTVTIDGMERKCWTVIARPWPGIASRYDQVMLQGHLWCGDNKPFDIAVVTYNVNEGIKAAHSKGKYFLKYEDGLDEEGIFNVGYEPDKNNAITIVASVSPDNNKFNMGLEWYLQTNKDEKYFENATHMGIMIFPRDENQDIRMWMESGYGCPLPDHEATNKVLNLMLMTGNSTISMDDWACIPEVISVGNYTSRTTYPILDGKTGKVEYETVDYIANSSSYGTSLNGVVTPVVCGPGTTVISAVNHLDGEYSNNQTASKKMTVEGTDYYWASMSGTSMSTPQVAGIMALWLQANPKLTRDDLMKVLKETSIPWTGEQVEKVRWGQYGRIDALAGMKYILSTLDIRDLQREQDLDAKSRVYTLGGQLVRSGVQSSEALRDLPAGIYIVNGRKVAIK